MTVFHPADAAAVQETVAWAVAEGQTLEVLGGGSKRALGRPPHTDHTLDLSNLAAIVDYDPPELVLTAQAAAPMATIQALLDDQRQMLAFEPPDWHALLSSDRQPTLGGTIACNLAGPRRVRAGAARDHFLGFAAVNGWGDAWKSGGRVVKNVTGYDICKLQAGAHGTLSVLTELTVRVLPRPETSCTLLFPGLSDEAGIRLLANALNTPNEVSAAAHLPGPAATQSALATAGPLTILRLEGPRPSVEFRAAALTSLLGRADRLDNRDSEALWRQIGSVQPLFARADGIVWRICPTPSQAPTLFAKLQAAFASAEALYDWAGGLLWLSLDPIEAGPDCGAAIIRAAIAEHGHATLLRAPEHARATIPPFHPAAPALDALARRVKASFDPKATLNPGRMQDGI